MIQSKILPSVTTQQTQNFPDRQPSSTNLNQLPSINQFQYRTISINSDKKLNLSHYLSAPELSLVPSQASDQKNQQEIQSTFHSSTAQADSTCKLPYMLAVPTSSFASSTNTTDRNSQPLKISNSHSNPAVVTAFPLITKSAGGFKSMLFLTPPKIGTKITPSIKQTKAALRLSQTSSHQINTQSSSFMHEQQQSQDEAIQDCVHAFTLDENLQSQEDLLECNNSNDFSVNSETDGQEGLVGDGVALKNQHYADCFNKKKRRKQKRQETGDNSMSEWDNKFNSLLQSPTVSSKFTAVGYHLDNENLTKSLQQSHLPKINVQLCNQPGQLLPDRNDILASQFSNKGLLASGFNLEGKNNKTLSFNNSAPVLPKLQNHYLQSNIETDQVYQMSAGSRKNGYGLESQKEQQDPYMYMYQNSNSTSNLLQLASSFISLNNNPNTKFYNQIPSSQYSDNLIGERKARSQYKGSFNFPEGGWVCCMCQNYNFYGRAKCNRCGKLKSKLDINGKPRHLIKKENQCFNQNQYFMPNPPDNGNRSNNQPNFPSPFISSPTNYTSSNQMQTMQNDDMMRQQHQQHQQSQHYYQQQTQSEQLSENPQSTYSLYNQINSNSSILSNQHLPVQLSLQQQQLQQQRSYKKPLTQRIGDWICLNCRNLNFSFRVVCNRCNLSRELYGQYVNKEAELMLPSINSPSSQSSSHNIPMGITAPQQHSHYFTAGNNNLYSPNNNYSKGMSNGEEASLLNFNSSILNPAFNPAHTVKLQKASTFKKRSNVILQQSQQYQEVNKFDNVKSKGINEQQVGH